MPATKATKAPAKRTGAAKAAPAARKRIEAVPADNVPAELRGFYDDPHANPRDILTGIVGEDDGSVLDFRTPTKEDRAAVEVEELFRADGTSYYIPKVFGPGLGLVYLDRAQEGRDIALGAVLKAALGPPGWSALIRMARLDAINEDQMNVLLGRVMTKVMGTIEENGEGNG